MKKYTYIIGLVVLTGCAGPSKFAEVIKASGTTHKHIKAEFSGWNAHFSYESWPATNGLIIIDQ